MTKQRPYIEDQLSDILESQGALDEAADVLEAGNKRVLECLREMMAEVKAIRAAQGTILSRVNAIHQRRKD